MKTEIFKIIRFVCFAYAIVFGFVMTVGMGSNPDRQNSGCQRSGSSSKFKPDRIRPTTPKNLKANAVSPGQIKLTWDGSSDNDRVDGYDIYRNGALYQKKVDSYPTSYNDQGGRPSKTYCYHVAARDPAGNVSKKSNRSCATTLDNEPPSKPTDISIDAVTRFQINLSWNRSNDDWSDVRYGVYRDGVIVVTLSGTEINDSGLNPYTDYCYTVTALDDWDYESAHSNEICATTKIDLPPNTPKNLIVSPISASHIDLYWDQSSDDYGIVGYNIYRDGILLKNVELNVTSDTGLIHDMDYCYNISAYDEAGNESEQSNQVCTTTFPDMAAPSIPENLIIIAGSQGELILEWDESLDDGIVVGYKVYKDGLLFGSFIDTTTTIDGLLKNIRYCFAVSAYDATGKESSRSQQVCAKTWTFHSIASKFKSYVSCSGIGLDSDDSVHVICSNWDGGIPEYGISGVAHLYYTTNASGSWHTEEVGNAFIESMAISSNNKIHIAATASSLYSEGMYISNASGLWSYQKFPLGVNFIGGSIAVASRGRVNIIYSDHIDQKLIHLRKNWGSWIEETIDNQTGFTSIAVNSFGYLHIVYPTKYATNASGSWSIKHAICLTFWARQKTRPVRTIISGFDSDPFPIERIFRVPPVHRSIRRTKEHIVVCQNISLFIKYPDTILHSIRHRRFDDDATIIERYFWVDDYWWGLFEHLRGNGE